MKQAEPDMYNQPFDSPAIAVSGGTGTIWLDSSYTLYDKGHRSLLAAHPDGEFVVRHDSGVWRHRNKRKEFRGNIWHSFSRLRSEIGGWWIGYISYEATLPFLGLKPGRMHDFLPQLHFYHYDSVIEFASQATKPGKPPCYVSERDIENPRPLAITQSLTKAEYIKKVRQILSHIREGDIYQANLTSCFSVTSDLKPFLAYYHLRSVNPAPYSAFLNFGDYQILSSSPERMVAKRGSSVTTTPIKGTIARGADEEANNREILLHSAKDRAELMMIVDLERNDLGRIAEIGSVSVDSSPRAETYASLIHLVSDVHATMRTGTTIDDLLFAILPGGSITGAPKRRAVEILSELETVPRGVYTGCIGYFHGDDLEFNIAIRTMVHRNGVYEIHAGGGIVADSDPEAEYAEMQLKAHNLFCSLETAEMGVLS